MLKQLSLIYLMLCGVVGMWAQKGATITNTFALTNVTVVKSPGETLEGATIIVKDGLIKAVGKNVKIPFDAKQIKADSMFVYAGFISGASHIGIPKVEKKEGTGRRGRDPDVKDPGNPPNAKAGIQPERSVRDLVKADDKSIAEMRKLGFTAAQVMPRGRMLPGKGSLLFLAGDSGNEMVAQEDISLFAQLQGASGRIYPSTVIGVMSKLRDLYHQAEQAKAHSESYGKNAAAGMRRPTSDPVLEAFFPVIAGDQNLVMKAVNAKDISRALALQKELGYRLTLVDVKQGWDYADKLKNTPVMLSLDLPAAKKEEKKKEAKEDEDEEKKELTIAEKEMEALEARRAKAMEQYETQAAVLAIKGVEYGFSTLNVKAKDIRANIGRMIKAGLTEEQALAALTTIPAKMLGIDKVAGTVEKGKVANLLVSDSPYFEKDSNVRYVFVDGQLFEYDAKPKKKKKAAGDADAPVDKAAINKIAGEWSYNMNAMGQQMKGTLTFSHEDGSWSGTMSDPQGSDEAEDLSDVEVDDSTVTFTIDAGGMTVEFELDFDGKDYQGTASVGAMGSFEIDGKRTADPENE